MLTLDRIVSVQDYEDFARAFAGIGKARARVMRDGEHNLVHLTVASATGGPVNETDPIYQSLSAALERFQDPTSRVRIQSFELLQFAVGAQVLIDKPTYRPADVLAAATASLLDRFSFQNQEFAQFLLNSQVIAAIQQVPGVISVRLTQFCLVGDSGVHDGLAALPAGWSSDAKVLATIKPAQLLLIDTNNVRLTEMLKP